MGYIFLAIALFAGIAKGYVAKRISGTVTGVQRSVYANFVRMLMCIAISVIVLLLGSKGESLVPDSAAVIYGTFAGISLATFTVTWLLAVKHGAYMLISVAQTFGTVVTLICSRIVLGTTISQKQFLGMILLFAAMLIMVSYSNGLKGALSVSSVILLVLCGVSNGLYEFSQKLFTVFSASPVATLNLITYLAGAIILGILISVPQKATNGSGNRDTGFIKKVIFPVFLMAVFLFLSSYFMAVSAKYLSPSQLYPISRAAGMILSTVMSAICFGEKVTPRCVAGLVLAFAAVMFLK